LCHSRYDDDDDDDEEASAAPQQKQQHSCHVQLGHWLGKGLALHSEGRQAATVGAFYLHQTHTLIIPFERGYSFILQLFVQVIAAYPRIWRDLQIAWRVKN
jgi:hypothetical protein